MLQIKRKQNLTSKLQVPEQVALSVQKVLFSGKFQNYSELRQPTQSYPLTWKQTTKLPETDVIYLAMDYMSINLESQHGWFTHAILLIVVQDRGRTASSTKI